MAQVRCRMIYSKQKCKSEIITTKLYAEITIGEIIVLWIQRILQIFAMEIQVGH